MASNDNTINILLKAQDQASAIMRQAAQGIKSDFDQTTRSLDANSRMSDITGAAWTRMSVVAGAVGGVVGTVVNRAIGEMSDLLGGAISRVDTLNNANRTFQNLGFTAQDTNDMMVQLKNSILGLPTSLNDAVGGVELLAGATNDVKLSGQIFSAVNDSVIGFGGTADQATLAVTQLSQALSNGTVDAQTWNSLINDGMGPALAAMARQMHISTGALKDGLSDGTYSVKEFEQSLLTLDTEGGGGMQSLQRIAKDSTDGIATGWTNAKTAITRGLADIIQSIGSSRISQALSDIGTGAESMMKKAAPYFGQFVNVVTDTAGRIGSALAPAVDLVSQKISEKFPQVKDRVDEVASSVRDHAISAFDDFGKKVAEKTPGILSGIEQVYQKLKSTFSPILGELKDNVEQKLMPTLTRLWKEVVVPLAEAIGGLTGATLVASLKLIVDTLNVVLPPLTAFMNFLLNHKQIVLDIGGALAAIKTGLIIQDTLAAFQSGFTTTMAIVAGESGVAGVSGAVTSLGGQLKNFAGWGLFGLAAVGAFQTIQSFLSSTQGQVDKLNQSLGAVQSSYDAAKAKYDASSKTTADKQEYIAATNSAISQNKAIGDKATTIANTSLPSAIANWWNGLPLFATGGYTGPGGVSDVAGVVHRGEYVVPQSQVDQRTGLPKASASGGGVSIANLHVHNDVDVNRFLSQISWRLNAA